MFPTDIVIAAGALVGFPFDDAFRHAIHYLISR